MLIFSDGLENNETNEGRNDEGNGGGVREWKPFCDVEFHARASTTLFRDFELVPASLYRKLYLADTIPLR